jgi:hypothetical protein
VANQMRAPLTGLHLVQKKRAPYPYQNKSYKYTYAINIDRKVKFHILICYFY